MLVLTGGIAIAQAPGAWSVTGSASPAVVPVDAFTIAPTTITFPNTAIGATSGAIDVTITNVSGASQTLTSVAGGAPSDATNFGGVQNCVGVTLADGASCAFSYTFHPTTTGAHTTTTSLTINGQSSGTINLSGTGTDAFTIAPTTITFPNTAIGATSGAIDVTITNVSGASQTLTSVAGGAPSDATNFGGVQNCVGVTLADGASCAFSYTFHPTTTGAHTTTTSLTINGQSSGTITLNGSADTLAISPTTLSFPATAVGDESDPLEVTVTNLTASPQTLSAVAGGAPLDATDFGGFQDCAGVTLNPGDSCSFTYFFTPASVGAHTTTTGITINGQSATISFTGTGVDAFSLTPTSLTFPDTVVGSTSAPQTVTVANTSLTTRTITVNGAAPADPTHFAESTSCDGVTLDPGDSCTFSYTFHPTTTGAHSTTATLSLTSEAVLELAHAGRSVIVTLAQESIAQTTQITLDGTGIAATPTPTPTPAPTPSTGTGTGTTLALTGADVAGPLALGGGALALGVLFLTIGRGRREQ